MPYTPHDWSPGTWALLLTCMVLFVMSIASTYLLLVHRACETTTGEHLTDEEISPVFAAQLRLPEQPAGISHDSLAPAPL